MNLERGRAELPDEDLDKARDAVAKNSALEIPLVLAYFYFRRLESPEMPELVPDEDGSDRWIDLSLKHHGNHTRRYAGLYNGGPTFSQVI